MNADAALVELICDRALADSQLTGTANLLVMPTLDAANIAFTLLKAASDGLPVDRCCWECRSPFFMSGSEWRAASSTERVAVLEAQAAPLLPRGREE